MRYVDVSTVEPTNSYEICTFFCVLDFLIFFFCNLPYLANIMTVDLAVEYTIIDPWFFHIHFSIASRFTFPILYTTSVPISWFRLTLHAD